MVAEMGHDMTTNLVELRGVRQPEHSLTLFILRISGSVQDRHRSNPPVSLGVGANCTRTRRLGWLKSNCGREIFMVYLLFTILGLCLLLGMFRHFRRLDILPNQLADSVLSLGVNVRVRRLVGLRRPRETACQSVVFRFKNRRTKDVSCKRPRSLPDATQKTRSSFSLITTHHNKIDSHVDHKSFYPGCI